MRLGYMKVPKEMKAVIIKARKRHAVSTIADAAEVSVTTIYEILRGNLNCHDIERCMQGRIVKRIHAKMDTLKQLADSEDSWLFLCKEAKNNKGDTMNYKCPKCGHTRIEEVMSDVTVTTTVDSVVMSDDSDFVCDYDKDGQSIEGGDYDTIRYQCIECSEEVTQEEMRALAKIKCEDCGNDYDKKYLRPWKYEPDIKLCDGCYDERMDEEDPP